MRTTLEAAHARVAVELKAFAGRRSTREQAGDRLAAVDERS